MCFVSQHLQICCNLTANINASVLTLELNWLRYMKSMSEREIPDKIVVCRSAVCSHTS